MMARTIANYKMNSVNYNVLSMNSNSGNHTLAQYSGLGQQFTGATFYGFATARNAILPAQAFSSSAPRSLGVQLQILQLQLQVGQLQLQMAQLTISNAVSTSAVKK
jgi:hypothetical protein